MESVGRKLTCNWKPAEVFRLSSSQINMCTRNLDNSLFPLENPDPDSNSDPVLILCIHFAFVLILFFRRISAHYVTNTMHREASVETAALLCQEVTMALPYRELDP